MMQRGCNLRGVKRVQGGSSAHVTKRACLPACQPHIGKHSHSPELDIEELADVAQREHSMRRQRAQPHLHQVAGSEALIRKQAARQSRPGGMVAHMQNAEERLPSTEHASLHQNFHYAAEPTAGLLKGRTSLISSGPIAHTSSTSDCTPGPRDGQKGRVEGAITRPQTRRAQPSAKTRRPVDKR